MCMTIGDIAYPLFFHQMDKLSDYSHTEAQEVQQRPR